MKILMPALRLINAAIVTLLVSLLMSVALAESAAQRIKINDHVTSVIEVPDEKEGLIVDGRELQLVPSRPVSPEPKPRAIDKARGYLTFVRAGRVCIGPEYRPAASELCDGVSAFASPGEFEPATFGVRPLKDLGEVQFSVTHFRNANGKELGGPVKLYGAEITAEQIGFTNAKQFRWRPKWLTPLVKRNLRKGRDLQIWVDIHVPTDSSPGKYTGSVRIDHGKGASSSMEIVLDVLPLQLARPLSWGFFVYGWYPPEKIPSFEAPLREMRRNGMSCCVISPMHFFHGVTDVKEQNGGIVLDTTYYDRALAVYRKVGFPDPPIFAVGPWVTQTISAMGRAKDFPKRFDDHGYSQIDIGSADRMPEEILDKLRWVLRRFYDHSLEENWPRFYIYLVDEPAAGSPKMEQAKLLSRLVREVAPEMATACTIYTLGWWREFGVGPDLNIVHYVHPAGGPEGNRRWVQFAQEKNCRLMGIDFLGGAVDTFWDGRYISLAAERAGLAGMICWTQHLTQSYSGDLDPYFGVMASWKGGPWWMTREDDGSYIPSVGWIGIREGIDDSRYYRTVRSLVERAENSFDPAIREAGEAGSFRMKAVLKEWPWVRDARSQPNLYNSARADQTRRKFAQLAIELKEILEKQRTGG